ncbi:MAG TPA: hypothetical protein VLV15_17295, partial [Dongiaceae bacterium]|nr:hypothetical protein [Dongiaceae bacterium]
MKREHPRTGTRTALAGLAVLCAGVAGAPAAALANEPCDVVRAAVPDGAIEHILVIDLENEDFGVTFGPTSPATYLNTTLLPQGELVTNYFATSHASLGNYLSQVSGQESTVAINNDCV